jgi:xanthine dehydrogenase accessory factor
MLPGGPSHLLRRFPLAAALGQCCGGLVELLFEVVAPSTAEAPWLDEIAAIRMRGEACAVVTAIERGVDQGGGPAHRTRVVTSHRGTVTSDDDGPDAGVRAAAAEMLASRDATQMLNLSDGRAFLLQALRPPPLDIVLFGAGHVGQALVRVLASLDCRVAWIDERDGQFPAEAAPNIRIEVTDTPVAEVAAADPGACFLVMTHSHALDQMLAEAILRRGDFRYFGLIGSMAKRRRFEQRLGALGLSPDTLARMTCPIGIEGVDGKAPAVIAVAVAAQLLSLQATTPAG